MNAARELVFCDLVRLTTCGVIYVDQVVRVKHWPIVFEMVAIYVLANPDMRWLPARVLDHTIESGEASVVRLERDSW